MGVYICTIICLLFIICNYCYKKTIEFQNSQLDIEDLLKDLSNNIQLVNLGSTYSKFAFSSLKKYGLNYADFSVRSQSLEMDQVILEKYMDHIAHSGIVILAVAPCVLLYREKGENLQYYSILRRSEYPFFKIKGYLKSCFPLINKPQKIKRLLIDQEKIKSIYETYPVQMSEQKSEIELRNLCDLWKRLFRMHNFIDANISNKNMENIEENKRIIEGILSSCIEKQLRPVIVVVPFSKRLNKYFSYELVYNILEKPIIEVINDRRIPYLNYQFDEQFQEATELFSDGGFRLNQRGSRIFINRLFEDLKQYGMRLENSSLTG